MPLMISSAHAQTAPAAAAPAPIQASSAPQLPVVTPVPVITTAEQPVIKLMMTPKPEFWEGPGFMPAIAAIVAVTIAYFSLQESTKKQIKATRDQAQIDRLMAARRENYEDFVDKFMGVQSMFATMIRVDHESVEFGQQLRDFGAPVNKTWLLSEQATALKARDLLSHLEHNWVELRPLAETIQNQRAILQMQKAAREESWAKQKELELGGLLGTAAQAAHANANARYEEAIETISDVKALIKKNTEDFGKKLLEMQPAVIEKFDALMYLARKEMGIKGDDELRTQSDELAQTMKEGIEQILKDMDKMSAANAARAPGMELK